MKLTTTILSLLLLAAPAAASASRRTLAWRIDQGFAAVTVEDRAGHRTYVRSSRALHVLGPDWMYLLSEEALSRGARGSGKLDLELARRYAVVLESLAHDEPEVAPIAAALRTAIAVETLPTSDAGPGREVEAPAS